MAEIRRTKPNGLTVASTFSGCGGSCLGFKMAGYRHVYASEFVPAARETYAANFPGIHVDDRDIRLVQPEDVLKVAGLKKGELDVLEGSPPCASFSTAGKRARDWGKVKAYCVLPGTKILGKDLRSKMAFDLKPGDEVVGFEEENRKGARGRRFLTTVVEAVTRLRRPAKRIWFEDGSHVGSSTDHRWLVVSGSNLRWKTTGRLRPGDVMLTVGKWDEEQTRSGGWLAGMFDGEGCVSRASGRGRTRLLGVAQKEGPTLERLRRELAARGFAFGDYPGDGSARTLNLNGGLTERLRFLGSIRPERLVAKAEKIYGDVNVEAALKVRIARIEDLGEQQVIAVSTRAKTFIADGFLSHNSDTKQRTDDLFFEFVRLLRGLAPRAFVAENVSGLVKGVAKGYFLEVLREMKASGYRVECRVLDAQWLGVPQARQRTIFVGVREDLDRAPAFPSPLPYRYSIRDAISGIGDVRFAAGTAARRARRGARGKLGADRPALSVNADGIGGAARHQVEVVGDAPSIEKYAIGPEWKRLRPGETSEKYFNLVRPDPDAPVPTVTQLGGSNAGVASVTHPSEPRKFSIAELRRLCGFPDDFVLTGKYAQQWERLGRAVPPPMMRGVAEALKGVLLAARA